MVHDTKYQSIYKDFHYSGKKPENIYHIKLLYFYMQNIFHF